MKLGSTKFYRWNIPDAGPKGFYAIVYENGGNHNVERLGPFETEEEAEEKAKFHLRQLAFGDYLFQLKELL